VSRKNIEDELCAINNPRFGRCLDVALLRRREIVIEDDERGRAGACCRCDFFELAAADQRGRISLWPVLQKFAGNLGPGTPR
jgi:hypothetical protein